MKITKEDWKEVIYVFLSPVSLVLMTMTFIVGVYSLIFSTNKITGIAALFACCMMLICALGWVNHIYQQLIFVKIERLDKKLTEWKK